MSPSDPRAILPGLDALLDEVRAAARASDASARLPQRFSARLRRLGFGRMRLPVEEGGLGASVTELIETVATVAAADASLAQSWRTHVIATERHLVSPAGPARERWLRRIADGAMIAGGWTEADGSAGRFTTRLTRTDGGLVLTGHKGYSTGSAYADWLEYSAVDDGGELVIAAVRSDAPGLSIVDDWDGFGQRATASGTTVLADVPVDPLDVGPFSAQQPGTAGWQQLVLLAVLAGIAEGAREKARELIVHVERAHGAAPFAALEEYGRISASAEAAHASLACATGLVGTAQDALLARPGRSGAHAENAEALAYDAETAVFRAQLAIVAQAVDAGDRLMALPVALGRAADADRLRRLFGLDRFWRDARTVSTHNAVALKARMIADRELHGIGTVATAEERAALREERLATDAAERALVAVRLGGSLPAELAADRALLAEAGARLADRDVALVVGDGTAFDAATAAALLIDALPAAWLVVETGGAPGHPYDFARRLASLEQLSGGRFAWALRGGADARTREHVRVAQQLWRSWPRESIAADGTAAHFAETALIRRVGADGEYRVAGPLNVPSSPQQLPVFAVDEGEAALDDPHSYVDLVVRGTPDGDEWRLPGAAPGSPAVVRVQETGTAAGLLRIADGLRRAAAGPPRTLRQRLGLPVPAFDELPGAGPRFVGDVPEAS
ncbi:hypothetical protein N8K70_15560 [Microbacterium betulae]|uniref:Rhodanese domain-containing protein n=1 Tax=Microbacterium betulae TaxID=2981139 RepID=A0AA97FI96_9MICO|nr:acyl-CoA dehydrogenase family protein [Microbacterium sp. AB]WOF22790.1 hypothetical protein N8K70_15560 [Microbacterium sp. AB]